jgi:hypothetical protein
VSGCGDEAPQTIDADKLEQEVERSLSTGTTQVASVSCPGDVESKTGAKLTCSAKLEDGGSAKVQVTETQAPNQFSYAFKPGSVKLPGESVAAELEKDLAAQGVRDPEVACPETVAVKPGRTVTCTATSAAGAGNVTFEFADGSGSIEESSIETGS